MLAYHSSSRIKAEYVARMKADIEADRLIAGHYWTGCSGCHVSRIIRGSDHAKFEDAIGFPTQLVELSDAICDGLPHHARLRFSLGFLGSTKEGSDLSMVIPKFTLWLLTSPDIDLAGKANEAGKESIAVVADLYRQWIEGANPSQETWAAAESAAQSAAESAARSAVESAAESAAWSARSAARSAAWSPARPSVRRAVESAVWSVGRSVANSPAGSAARSADAIVAGSAAQSAAWEKMAAQLLVILAESSPS